MPSLSDRKEIAAKLRSKFMYGLGITPGSIAYALGYTAPKGATYDGAVRDLFGLLADLIDPTCELDLDFGMEYIVCQSCGYELPHGTHLDETKYCPNCGSRVVVSKDE